MSRYLLFPILLILTGVQFAAAYNTPNSQVSWTMDSLAAHSNGAVTGAGRQFSINQSVTISATDTLHVLPGDTILFIDQSGVLKLEALGSLVIQGTAAHPVLFSSENQTAGDYSGIEFRSRAAGLRQEMHHCTVEYAERLVKAVNADPQIDSSTFRYSSEAALDLTGSNAIIQHNQIMHNRRYALKMTLGSSPLVENNRFEDNNYQNTSPIVIITIGLQGVNSPIIRGNLILGGYLKSGGIAVWAQSNALIENNHIENCAYGILCFQSGANPIIRKNTLLNNSINPDTVNFGFGIACNGSNHPVVTGNSIQGHFYGLAIINGAQPNAGNLSNTDTTDDGGNRFIGNGIGHKKYELYNNNTLPIMAEGNWWGTADPDSIEARIVHQFDNPAFGPVDFQPFLTGDPLPVADQWPLIPESPLLLQNYPNPFNATTVIQVHMPQSDFAHLAVYDLLGKRLITLYRGKLQGGVHRFSWNGQTSRGISVSSGLYFYRLQTTSGNFGGKMLLAR